MCSHFGFVSGLYELLKELWHFSCLILQYVHLLMILIFLILINNNCHCFFAQPKHFSYKSLNAFSCRWPNLSEEMNKCLILCSLEGQSEVFLPLLWIQGAEVKSIRKETMDQSTEGQPITPGRREVFYVDALKDVTRKDGRKASPIKSGWQSSDVRRAHLLKTLRWTDLEFASLVLTPMQDLLFDWCSGSWGCGRPLDLEVAGNWCPANITAVHIYWPDLNLLSVCKLIG